jgi:hypothetical protein
MEMEGAGEKQSIIRTFEDLDVWKVCRNLRAQITTIARTFPKEEHIDYGISLSERHDLLRPI